MSEEDKISLTDGLGFMALNAMEGMKIAIPIVFMLAISAKFIERLTLVAFKIGGE